MKTLLQKVLLAVAVIAPALLSAQTIEEMTDIFWNKSSCRNFTAERRAAMGEMQTYVDTFTHTLFNEYLATPEGTDKERGIESWGLMKYYNMAFEKVLAEVPATQVKKGEVVVWQLYNMGYIVKTQTQCFGVDVYHKHAEKLAPMIDFMMITHNHADHQWKPLIAEMERQGKAVYSNFMDMLPLKHLRWKIFPHCLENMETRETNSCSKF